MHSQISSLPYTVVAKDCFVKSEWEKPHCGGANQHAPTQTPCNQPAIVVLTLARVNRQTGWQAGKLTSSQWTHMRMTCRVHNCTCAQSYSLTPKSLHSFLQCVQGYSAFPCVTAALAIDHIILQPCIPQPCYLKQSRLSNPRLPCVRPLCCNWVLEWIHAHVFAGVNTASPCPGADPCAYARARCSGPTCLDTRSKQKRCASPRSARDKAHAQIAYTYYVIRAVVHHVQLRRGQMTPVLTYEFLPAVLHTVCRTASVYA